MGVTGQDDDLGYAEIHQGANQVLVPAVFRNGFQRWGEFCGDVGESEPDCQGSGMWVEFYSSSVRMSLDLITYTGKFANKEDKTFGCYTIEDETKGTVNCNSG